MARSVRKSGKRRLPNRQAPVQIRQVQPEEVGEEPLFSLIFLASGFPADFAAPLESSLATIQEDQAKIDCHLVDPDDGTVFVQISFAQHVLHLVGIVGAAPNELISHAIDCAHWSKEEKAVLRAHSHHYFCQYMAGSDDISEQMLAINKVAVALKDAGVLGTVDPEAWNCAPSHILHKMMISEPHQSLLQDPPLEVWAGFAKFFKGPNEVWFCSKAFHRWGVVDFAWLGEHAQGMEAFELFRALFNYVRDSNAVLQVGHTAQFGDNLILRFAALTEYHEYLQGPLDTLVIERLNPKEFH